MEYNPDVHGIECPKCGHGMDEISYGGDLLIDRCTNCAPNPVTSIRDFMRRLLSGDSGNPP